MAPTSDSFSDTIQVAAPFITHILLHFIGKFLQLYHVMATLWLAIGLQLGGGNG
jgi:hypothetical protein